LYKTLQPAKNKSEHHTTRPKTGITIIVSNYNVQFFILLVQFFLQKKFFFAFLSRLPRINNPSIAEQQEKYNNLSNNYQQ